MDDELIFNKWETGNFILLIWTHPNGVVENVEIQIKPMSLFAARKARMEQGVTRADLERLIAVDVERQTPQALADDFAGSAP